MEAIADMIDTVLHDPGNEKVHRTMLERVKAFTKGFPFYSSIYSL
jgi:glycine/serine hydroxymethyltransferase